MQTNALSRQVALLAEPLDSTMSTSSGFFVHTMKHCYATTEAIHYTCAYKFTARVQSRALYTEGMRKISPFRE